LNIDIQVQTLDDRRLFTIKSLLDCRSTGSCIDRKFVERNQILTKKTAIPSLSITQMEASIVEGLSQTT